MGRGKFINHKGRNRHFTNPEELEEQRRQEEEKRKLRQNKVSDTSSDEEDEAAGGKNDESDSDDSDSKSESDTESKAKGVENLIQVENPNRVQKKAKKLSQLNEALANASKPELSRREREQLEKERAKANYQKLHAAGKTDQARADLARLAIIKQQREEAAKKREDEKKAKEMAAQKQKEMTQKALGKRT
ncbi:PREDICTED: 28 kDa heat- and acid-stable phosphoprotein-like [Ceratosolen solmsi marchali]|uniref:28 kDa heat- and acid-stable phosphoprotein-like n=1 Tax=Ceratosolen solmsi marchali TaxID=326594 RepID=A0AAJ6YFR0_9HYME|nr:PREDICTED: 28 kDa heat- and acid-stable phosphoprotein-like [Ceratosolen solmsi marchali]